MNWILKFETVQGKYSEFFSHPVQAVTVRFYLLFTIRKLKTLT
jgi:hypothetical protein